MTKNLWLLRHADAVSEEVRQKDIERELSAKGYQDATRLGHHLYTQQQDIDLIVASIAERAQRTAEILMEQMHYSSQKLQLSEELYQASVRSMLAVINQQSDDVHQLMVVGHNPTLTYLAEYLSGEAVNTIAPGGLFSLRLLVDRWEEVAQQTVSVDTYITPEQLRA